MEDDSWSSEEEAENEEEIDYGEDLPVEEDVLAEEEEELEEDEEGGLEVEEEGYDEAENVRLCDDRPTKRSKNLVDRLSALPDSIICHILSLMPTRDAVRTSFLSKRWDHTWASTSTLIYVHEQHGMGSLKRFTKFVNKTMILHNSSKIHKFFLKSSYECFMESSVSLWVHAAVIKQVEELTIKLRDHLDDFCQLPQSLYSCDSLTKLSLSCCRISPVYSQVRWRSLKHLTATRVELDDDVIHKFLAGSPLLESLKLKDCGVYGRVFIYSKILRRLVINGYGASDQDRGWFDIYAPYLQSLEILCFMNRKKCRLKNVSSLIDATLTFCMRSWSDYDYEDEDDNDDRKSTVEVHQNMVRDLLVKVHHVQNLTLGTWIVQVLSTCALKQLPSPILKIKVLILEIDLCKKDLPGVASLLRTSAILERFVIDLSSHPLYEQIGLTSELSDHSDTNYWISKNILSQRLKTIEIIGFSELVTELAQFLLQNVGCLEKMVFTRKNSSDSEWQQYFGKVDFFKVIQKLLSFPRSSSKAQILLL